MKKKLFAILALALSCALIPAGCGQSDPPPEGPPSLEGPAPTPSEPQQPEPPETIEGLQVIPDEEINSFVSDGLRLFGRTYLLRNTLCLDNGATGFETTFYGTTLKAELTTSTNLLYFRVFVDGEEEGVKKKLDGSVYTLAKDLEEGVHTVRLVKAISSQNGVICVNRLTTDGKFLRPEKKDRLRIEFVGDSISVGAGVLGGPGGNCTVENSDAAKGYAYLTARALDADYSIVATEGICVNMKGWLPISMMEMYGRLSSTTAGKYSFPEEYDVVVVALGTNDASYMSAHPYTQAEFSADYIALLDLIRSKNPNARIVCVYGMMGADARIEQGIKDAIAQKEDEKIAYLQLPADRKGADSHPSSEGAKKQSETLLSFLREIL